MPARKYTELIRAYGFPSYNAYSAFRKSELGQAVIRGLRERGLDSTYRSGVLTYAYGASQGLHSAKGLKPYIGEVRLLGGNRVLIKDEAGRWRTGSGKVLSENAYKARILGFERVRDMQLALSDPYVQKVLAELRDAGINYDHPVIAKDIGRAIRQYLEDLGAAINSKDLAEARRNLWARLMGYDKWQDAASTISDFWRLVAYWLSAAQRGAFDEDEEEEE